MNDPWTNGYRYGMEHCLAILVSLLDSDNGDIAAVREAVRMLHHQMPQPLEPTADRTEQDTRCNAFLTAGKRCARLMPCELHHRQEVNNSAGTPLPTGYWQPLIRRNIFGHRSRITTATMWSAAAQSTGIVTRTRRLTPWPSPPNGPAALPTAPTMRPKRRRTKPTRWSASDRAEAHSRRGSINPGSSTPSTALSKIVATKRPE